MHTIELLGQKGKISHIKHGRIYMFISELGNFVSLVKIKSTNWDQIKSKNVYRLISSHRRQIWKYVNEYVDIKKTDVCPGIIYPITPKNILRREIVEKLLMIMGFRLFGTMSVKIN